MSAEPASAMTYSDETHSIQWLPWIVCFSAALFFFYEFIQMNMFNAIDHSIQQAFSLDAAQLGNLSAIYFIANVVFLFPAGALLDRYSTKRIILSAMALCVLGTFLFAHAQTFAVAAFCRFLTGIGSAFVFLSCMRLASRWFPTERMALITGCIVTMAMLGGVLAQTPLTLLVEKFGWRQALQIDGLFGLFIIFIIMMNVRDFPPNFQSKDHEVKKIGFFRSFRLTYFKAQNWLAAFYTCLMNMPLGILGVVWGVPYLTEVHHLSATQASVVTSMIFFGTIVGGPVIGWLSDHFCVRKLPMIIGSIASLAVVSVFLKMSVASFDQLLAIFFVLGFVTSTQVLSYPTVAESNSPLLTATALSVISIITQGGIAVFESLYGRVIEHFWQGQTVQGVQIYSAFAFHEASLMIPAGFLVALIAALLIRETHCKNPHDTHQ